MRRGRTSYIPYSKAILVNEIVGYLCEMVYRKEEAARKAASSFCCGNLIPYYIDIFIPQLLKSPKKNERSLKKYL